MARRAKRYQEDADFVYDYKYILPQHFKLYNGVKMPAIGLGTFKIYHYEEILNTVDAALNAGYRMFDTAALYGNEVSLNMAFQKLLPKYRLEREDIFITTKLSPSDYGGGFITERAFNTSLRNLGLDYIDLYLVHYPGNYSVYAEYMNNPTIPNRTWATLANLYFDRRIRALGVANYTVHHLNYLVRYNHGVLPAVNQVEWHPYYNSVELYDFCQYNKIVLQAYSSLGGPASSILLNDPTVVNVAEDLGVTPAQLLLVWSLQQEVSVIPKSVNPDRIRENFKLEFLIPDEELETLNALYVNNRKFCWDPTYLT